MLLIFQCTPCLALLALSRFFRCPSEAGVLGGGLPGQPHGMVLITISPKPLRPLKIIPRRTSDYDIFKNFKCSQDSKIVDNAVETFEERNVFVEISNDEKCTGRCFLRKQRIKKNIKNKLKNVNLPKIQK